MSTDHSKINMILKSPQSHDNGHDDEVTPLPKVPEQDDKIPSSAHREAKYKVRDQSSSKKRSSLRSLYRSIKSFLSKKKCSIKESKLKIFLSSFMIILMLANVALIVLFGVYFFHEKDTALVSANGALSYIASSLSADPILDIQAGPSCPQGYARLLLGVWPGTTEGCDCPSYLKSGKCGRREKSCTGVSSISPINMYDWGTSEWCVLKAKPGNQYKKAVECDQGFRKCSSGICVLETLDCPVTKVEMVGGAISTESVVGEPPVIGFAITPNDIPCFSDDHFASGPVAPYELIDENEHGCGKYGLDDQYSFALNQQKQKELFGQNNFPKKVYSLPDYDKVYQKTDSVLSYRRRLNIAENDLCLNMDTEALGSPLSITKDLKRYLKGTLMASFFIHGILLLLAGVCGVAVEACAVKSLSKALQGEGDSKTWIMFYFLVTFVEYIDFIVMFAATVYYRARMVGVKDYLVELAEAGCFLDLQAQAVVGGFQVVVDGVVGDFFKYSLSLFLVGSVALFSSCYLLRKLLREI